MFYKLKATKIVKGVLKVCIADSSIRPVKYMWTDHQGTLDDFVRSIYRGDVHPLSAAKYGDVFLRDAADAMFMLDRVAYDIGRTPDRLYGCDYADRLEKMVVNIGKCILIENRGVRETEKEEVRKLNEEAGARYAEVREKLSAKGIIFVSSAVVSRLFPGYDVMCTHDDRVFLGKRENYDNRGKYDNADGSAIFPSDDMEQGCLFRFFGGGSIPNRVKPAVRWERLHGLPGWQAAELLYNQ